MVYYIVQYRGVKYYNRASMKAVLGVGDAGFLAHLADRRIVSETLLDITVYYELISEGDIAKDVLKHVVVQDLDQQVKGIAGKNAVLDWGGFPLRLKGEKTHSFVPLDSVCIPDRYRWVKGQPHIKVFGKKYVALSAK